MKVYRVVLEVQDDDNIGENGITTVLESTKFPNWCISPRVVSMDGVDIGEWRDDHPLNGRHWREEFARLFQDHPPKSGTE